MTCDTIKKVVEQTGAEVTIRKVEDIMEIMKYNVIATPAVVVDGEVKIKGHVPSEKEIKKIIGL
jgi:small redox-active disulfide protein 2